MKKLLLCIPIAALFYSSCSKDHSIQPSRQSYTISIIPGISAITVLPDWPQVIGGEALITFTPANSDTVTQSVVTDSLNLKDVSKYSRSVFAGIYNISLATKSTALADTFIRFTSQVNSLNINKDQTISFQGVTNDGVITLAKNLIDTTVTPTFTPAGSTKALNLGKSNGFYFIYAGNNTTGVVSFVEITSGYTYMKQLTVSAMNRYDLSPIPNSTSTSVRHSLFQSPVISKSNL